MATTAKLGSTRKKKQWIQFSSYTSDKDISRIFLRTFPITTGTESSEGEERRHISIDSDTTSDNGFGSGQIWTPYWNIPVIDPPNTKYAWGTLNLTLGKEQSATLLTACIPIVQGTSWQWQVKKYGSLVKDGLGWMVYLHGALKFPEPVSEHVDINDLISARLPGYRLLAETVIGLGYMATNYNVKWMINNLVNSITDTTLEKGTIKSQATSVVSGSVGYRVNRYLLMGYEGLSVMSTDKRGNELEIDRVAQALAVHISPPIGCDIKACISSDRLWVMGVEGPMRNQGYIAGGGSGMVIGWKWQPRNTVGLKSLHCQYSLSTGNTAVSMSHNHWLKGCDSGLSWDATITWCSKSQLPALSLTLQVG